MHDENVDLQFLTSQRCSFPNLTGSREAILLVASRNQIITDDIISQPNNVRSLVRDGRNIVAVDFDSVTDRVYWSDTTQDKIWSAHKNGSDRAVVITQFFLFSKPEQMLLQNKYDHKQTISIFWMILSNKTLHY